MSAPTALSIMDACRRYVASAAIVTVSTKTGNKDEWVLVARWKIVAYTRADEICEAVQRVTMIPGRYRIAFVLRSGGDRFIAFTRASVKA